MKKSVLFVLFFLLILNLSFIASQNLSVNSKAYDCLESKVKEKCSSISLEDKIFSLLAIDECKESLLLDSSDGECWPKDNCKIKETALSALALRASGNNIDKITAWLLSQKIAPPDIDWLLQIESLKPTTCTIEYEGNSYSIMIDENKKIDKHAGTCLRKYEDDYWLKVTESCYETEFEISCDESFSTTLLYKDQDSETVYITGDNKDVSATGTATEKVDSFCFKKGVSCDYEGSLWATLVLKYEKENISPYLPYLITDAQDNEQFLPEVFLYLLIGGDYKGDILLNQKENKYWMKSTDRFYDTALALYAFQYDNTLQEKKNSIAWLTEVQGKDGCWQGIRDTAFLLYSIWPKKAPAKETCSNNGYCMPSNSCKELTGKELDYACAGLDVCCSIQKKLKTCAEENGLICKDNKVCSGGTKVLASDLAYGEECCVGGSCVIFAEKDECEQYNGICRNTCNKTEEEKNYKCSSGTCCLSKAEEGNKEYTTGIIIISVLIGLTLLGIIFRKKLRYFWFKLKSNFKGKRGPSPAASYGPGTPPPSFSHAPLQRKIIPRTHHPYPVRHPSPSKRTASEIDEVLKKLKEIGK